MHENDADVLISKSPSSETTIWESWLDQQGLSYLKEPYDAPPSILVLNKQVELGKVVQDMLSQTLSPKKVVSIGSRRWTEASLNQMNARLFNWCDSLSGEMRWDRWGSSSDVVHPSIAALHMLYHTIRISLNRPFVKDGPEAGQSHAPSDSVKICNISTDIILSILHRFRAQHGLLNSPLIFVHSSIRAADATIAIARFNGDSHSLHHDATIQALDAALDELSGAWALAAHARKGLQALLKQVQVEKQEVLSNYSSSVESNLNTESLFFMEQSPVSLEMSQGLKLEGSIFGNDSINGLQYEGLNDLNIDNFDLNYIIDQPWLISDG